jgi:hypothetical protein
MSYRYQCIFFILIMLSHYEHCMAISSKMTHCVAVSSKMTTVQQKHIVFYGMLSVRLWFKYSTHSPPSSAEVEEWVELYIHSPNMPSWRGA